MYLLILNIKNQVIDKYLISKGSYNSVLVTSADIITPVLKADGRNFALAHNHPSGSVEPSEEDIVFSKKIQKACEIVGLSFVDNLIYTPTDFFSFKQKGIL